MTYLLPCILEEQDDSAVIDFLYMKRPLSYFMTYMNEIREGNDLEARAVAAKTQERKERKTNFASLVWTQTSVSLLIAFRNRSRKRAYIAYFIPTSVQTDL